MRVLGLLSGTSFDGIDAAVVEFTPRRDALHARIDGFSTFPYDDAVPDRLRAALPPAALSFADVCVLDTVIGQNFAAAASSVIERTGPVDLVCSHGQTVYHWTENGTARGTLQLGQPTWIAERVGVPVVSDLRVRDVAAGGQGAPLVAYLDVMLLGDVPGKTAAVNLGGIANITVPRTPAGPVAYDLGPANALIDAAVDAATGGRQSFDMDGRLAASGRVDESLLAELLRHPYYELDPPKTTGKEMFNAEYLRRLPAARTPLPDLVATLTALTAELVAREAVRWDLDDLVIAGGGVHNATLMRMIKDRSGAVSLRSPEEFGTPADAKEAVAFALIGWLTAHGLPGNLPMCTGARGPRILGTITPGAGPLRLPEPLPTPPSALRIE